MLKVRANEGDTVSPRHQTHLGLVVGVDGSPTSELATEIAFDEASRRGVGLVALHARSDMGPLDFPNMNRASIEWANIKVREEEVLAQRLSGWRNRYPGCRGKQNPGVRSAGKGP